MNTRLHRISSMEKAKEDKQYALNLLHHLVQCQCYIVANSAFVFSSLLFLVTPTDCIWHSSSVPKLVWKALLN